MAWNITPGAALLTDVGNLYPYVSQFFDAIRERGIAAGQETWAAQAHTYASGVLTSAVDNGDGTVTFGDSGADWRDTAGNLRWTAATPGAHGVPIWSATSFDIIVDAPDVPSISEVDPRKVVQVAIGTQPTLNTVKCTLGVADRVAERVITAVGDWVGRRYWIVRRGGDNWTRGFPAPPNCGAYATGLVTVTASGTLTSATGIQNQADITSAGAADVVYIDVGGHLQRGALTGVSGNVITYTGTTALPVVGARFFVIESGGVWKWGAQGGFLQSFYGGLVDGYYGHDLDDTVGVAGLPSPTYPVLYGTDSLSCPLFPTDVPIYHDPASDGRDIDLYVPYDNVCGPGDLYPNTHVLTTLRGAWCEGMRLCAAFVKPIDWSGFDGVTIPNMTVAVWLNYAGINGVTGTTGTHTGTTMPCVLSVPHTPTPLWWTIKDAHGAPLLSGYTDSYNGSTINGAFSAAHDGKAVEASVGPTRVCPKRVGRMSDVVYFVPSLAGDPEAAQLPPSNTYPGTWTIRPASTHYSVPDVDGRVADSTLSRHAIADGDYARYVGDNLNDPGLAVLLPSSVDQPLKTYHNYAYVGARRVAIQNAIDGAMSGTATGGSNRRIVVAGVDFDALDFMPASNGLTHSFTAASGSTTGCTVPGVSGTALWASARFPGFAGPFVGFCVEVLISGTGFADPAAVVERRLVATGTTGGVITWAEATSASVNGKTCRIVEPFVLNPFRGRRLILTAADGTTTATVIVEGSHGDTLFIPDPGFPMGAGATFRPDPTQPRISDVAHRVSGAWVSTAGTGDDPRNPGTNPFKADARLNAEDTFLEYGLPLPNDMTFGFQTGWQELYDAINALTTTKVSGGTWILTTANARLGHYVPSASFNAWYTGAVTGSPPAGDPTDYYNYGDKNATAPPNAFVNSVKNGSTSFAYGGTISRVVNKLRVSLVPSLWSSSVDYYDYGDTVGDPSTDPDIIFDANGDAVAFHAWTKWSTVSAAAMATQADSGQLGVLGTPPANHGGGALTGSPPTEHQWAGYAITNFQATREWDFKFVA